MRKIVVTLALLITLDASAELVPGWVGIPLFLDDGGVPVVVPSVIGEASAAAADTILEGVGLDLGAEAEVCSTAANNEIIGQDPTAGSSVQLGSLVNVVSSNGVACANRGRPGVRLKGVRMPGL